MTNGAGGETETGRVRNQRLRSERGTTGWNPDQPEQEETAGKRMTSARQSTDRKLSERHACPLIHGDRKERKTQAASHGALYFDLNMSCHHNQRYN